MEGLILGVNILYRLFCFFKVFPMVGKGLSPYIPELNPEPVPEPDPDAV